MGKKNCQGNTQYQQTAAINYLIFMSLKIHHAKICFKQKFIDHIEIYIILYVGTNLLYYNPFQKNLYFISSI